MRVIGLCVLDHLLRFLLELQHVGDKMQQLVGVALYDAEQFMVAHTECLTLAELLQRAVDERQRRAQLVARIGVEVVLFIAEFLHPSVGAARDYYGTPPQQYCNQECQGH